MSKYTIGLDYGTLSGRAVLVDVADGRELADTVFDYPHGVMDKALPDGTSLGVDWALQHPSDYLEVLEQTIPAVLRESGVNPADVIGIGVDVTSSTLLPIRRDGTPLCLLEEYAGEPNAWVKLWKHHAAQHLANRITETAQERGEAWLNRYGGKVSSEWQLPKVWQVLEEAPHIYEDADCFIEAGDWLVARLTGTLSRSACMAGYKGLWHKREGDVSGEFRSSLHPGLERFMEEKLDYPLAAPGERVGGLTLEMAERLGLPSGIAVAAANIDAHVTVPAVGIEEPGSMLAIMGTSTCHMVLGKEEKQVPGICGYVEDGILPDMFGYEAGQSCVGDGLAWFVDNCIPARYHEEAVERGIGIHALLREKAEKLSPGESGLIALDWWNGNRSVLVDVDLSGLLLGQTLQTRPEEIYRALIESTAYGTRKIIETFRESGVEVNRFYASGGISQKDPMTMQIYADVTGLPIRIAGSRHGPALGSAIYAAVAAGEAAGGYADVFQAARRMGKLRDEVYEPIPENRVAYNTLYEEYLLLHDYFGCGGSDVMKRLKAIRINAKKERNETHE